MTFPAGGVVFIRAIRGTACTSLQSGVIEMVIGDKVVEVAARTKQSASCR